MANPYVRHRPVENLVLVRERDRRKMRELAWMAVAVLPLAVVLLGYTWVRQEIVQTGYEVRNLERRLEERTREERLKRLELSRLSAPERVAEVATGELGMHFPPIEQLVYVVPQ
ncbi:MAG: cell division protein FtsL [Acidobacteriota bacterium]|nr:cell division protein FtsL [Acidobacteriota bacterium]